jgi:hypothetical protein
MEPVSHGIIFWLVIGGVAGPLAGRIIDGGGFGLSSSSSSSGSPAQLSAAGPGALPDSISAAVSAAPC